MDWSSLPNDARVLCTRLSNYRCTIHCAESHDDDGTHLGYVALSIHCFEMESVDQHTEQFCLQCIVCDLVYSNSLRVNKPRLAHHNDKSDCSIRRHITPFSARMHSINNPTFPDTRNICPRSHECVVELLQLHVFVEVGSDLVDSSRKRVLCDCRCLAVNHRVVASEAELG